MKNIFTTLSAIVLLAGSATAQPILAGGFGTTGMGLVNGTTYTRTGTLGSGGFPFVSASKDGSKFYAVKTGKLMFIDVATSAFTDSLDITLRNLASSNEPDMLFATTLKSLVRINTTTKAVVDSIVLGVPWLPEERPNSKEVWVTDSGKVHVVDYSSGLTESTISLTATSSDYAGVRFSTGGSMAFKSAATSKKLFKINTATKAVDLSINTYPVRPGALVVSHDSSKVFVTDVNTSRVMIYKTSDLSLEDSIILDKGPMNIYLHPTRAEIWVVHHFDDSVSVYNENTKALIASFDVAGSPWYLAFGSGSVTPPTRQFDVTNTAIKVYPNPADDNINITGTAAGDRINVYDIAGRQVHTWTATSTQSTYSIADLKTGTYTLKVLGKQGETQATLPLLKR